MEVYLTEFFALAIAHLLAVMSPGPDFAMVLRSSITRSRRFGIWTSVGLGLGILVHVAYSLLGLGFIIAQSVVLFTIIKWIGALYLIYIGVQSLRARKEVQVIEQHNIQCEEKHEESALRAVRIGFFTNVLNPKATLFFLSLFSVVVSPTTPIGVKLIYGLEMSVMTFAWFACIASLFTIRAVHQRFSEIKHYIERVTGVILVALGIKILATK